MFEHEIPSLILLEIVEALLGDVRPKYQYAIEDLLQQGNALIGRLLAHSHGISRTGGMVAVAAAGITDAAPPANSNDSLSGPPATGEATTGPGTSPTA
jgi:hypothetical protein